jgi:DsbC/DsbD-like thiol-disulfide interchange protein
MDSARQLSGSTHAERSAVRGASGMRRVGIAAGVAASVVMWSAAARAQERPVVWTADAATIPVAPGSIVTIRLHARIDQGWHMYSTTQGAGGPIPTRILIEPGQPFTLVDSVTGPAATRRFDPNFGITVDTYDAGAAFAVRVRVAPDAPAGPRTIALIARYQACNATVCIPPRTEKLSAAVSIAATKARGSRQTG